MAVIFYDISHEPLREWCVSGITIALAHCEQEVLCNFERFSVRAVLDVG